jgi:hypothetical protein
MGITAPLRGSDERQPLIRRRSFDAYDANTDDVPAIAHVAGGMTLGVPPKCLLLINVRRARDRGWNEQRGPGNRVRHSEASNSYSNKGCIHNVIGEHGVGM